MYRRKTARYTVALPLRVGACLASQNFAKFPEIEGIMDSLMEELEAFGESLGIVFQLQDDRLGLFGDENSIGKSIGSDIREGKKTPYIISLLPKLSPAELQHFEEIFGLPNTSNEDVQWLCSLILSKKTDLEIQEVVRAHISSAQSALQSISALRCVSATAVRILEDFIEFSTERSK
jgi:geranylgeranyl diphosphate synthase type I